LAKLSRVVRLPAAGGIECGAIEHDCFSARRGFYVDDRRFELQKRGIGEVELFGCWHFFRLRWLDCVKLLVWFEEARFRFGLGYSRAWGHGFGEPHIAADDAAFPNHRIAAQNRRARVDHDSVLDGRVTLLPAKQSALFVLWERKRAEGDSLIELDIVSDDRG